MGGWLIGLIQVLVAGLPDAVADWEAEGSGW